MYVDNGIAKLIVVFLNWFTSWELECRGLGKYF